jgi:acetyl-CoA acetyltransferase
MTLRDDVFVIGVGMSRFGGPTRPLDGRIMDAALEALDDASIPFTDVQALYLGTALLPPTFGTGVVKDLGLTGLPVVRVENASATGGAAFYEAVQAVGSGRLDVAMALGFDDPAMSQFGGFNDVSTQGRSIPMMEPAVPPMAFFAMWAVRRMAEHGTTIETLGKIAVKNWNNARHNPKAERQADAPVTLEQVLGSRMLAYPHTARMAAPQGAGSAAAIVCSRVALDRLGRSGAVRVIAAQAQSERYVDGHLFAGAVVGPPEMAHRGAFAAYEESGLGPEDLRVLAFHDAYAIEELLYYEEIGLCGPGEGDRLVHDGVTELSGRWPTSTDGGFIGRGHPAGPTGLAQIWELAQQLRGRAGGRQVDRATTGLAHIIGAGSVCYTHILQAV